MHLPLPKVYWSASPVAGFLGMSDVHEFGFKWLWMQFTSRHLAVNCHTAGNWCYPLIWLHFVAFEAQMNHSWGHFRMPVIDTSLAHHFVLLTTPNQPLHRDHLWYWLKNYLNWRVIRLAIHWVVDKLNNCTFMESCVEAARFVPEIYWIEYS